MKRYHKIAWAEYKRVHGIKSRNFVQQKILIKTILRILGNTEFFEEAEFIWLKGSAGKPFKVDAYFPQFNLVVEYDGEQHFFPVRWKGQSTRESLLQFNKQRERDVLKERLVRDRGLNLVRFNFKEPIDNVDYVRNRLAASSILC